MHGQINKVFDRINRIVRIYLEKNRDGAENHTFYENDPGEGTPDKAHGEGRIETLKGTPLFSWQHGIHP
jgi:hypothetical protein